MHEYYRTRKDISGDDISAEREDALREVFALTEPGEYIQDCVAASFEPDSPLEEGGVVLGSHLTHERMFTEVASYMSGKDVDKDTRKASATVIDKKTDDKLSCHVSENRVLVTPREEDVSFESFRDYLLFLEQRLGVELTPLIGS